MCECNREEINDDDGLQISDDPKLFLDDTTPGDILQGLPSETETQNRKPYIHVYVLMCMYVSMFISHT